jgi:hypothetical protein
MTTGRLDDRALDTLFRSARTHRGWQDRPLPDGVLAELYDLAKWGPTNLNCSPMRLVFVKSPAAKERLRPCLDAGNVAQTMAAPATAIVGMDRAFYEHLPRLMPFVDARPLFAGDEPLVAATALRNASLQGAYLILAARAGPRLRADVRVRPRPGGRGLLRGHGGALELPVQPGLWRPGAALPARPAPRLRGRVPHRVKAARPGRAGAAMAAASANWRACPRGRVGRTAPARSRWRDVRLAGQGPSAGGSGGRALIS